MSIGSDDELTRAASTAAATSGSLRSSHPVPGGDAHRFAPGSIIAGRYRVVALLGRGGMGEVYRAEDLTLEQPVALKFLPGIVAAGDTRLAQFHNELKTARQVSHKNVCRLYDLGEADGRRFLTMEYVDGEDLSSLLRRIGRIPHDKAVEIARQLCAGLAAAHDRGVVHRDLKPSNVMIDADGNVRITDFGIATAAGAADTGFAGTPQYMAPEQFAGQPASMKSDIYALGLILFEVFTGRRAVDAKTLPDLQRFHESSAVTTPSAIVRDLDPTVERVILRCLEREPDRRPASAFIVAAALPGSDPLAAALAAGETPSPQLLAAAGETEAIRARTAMALTATALIAMLAFSMASAKTSVVGMVPLDLPPAVLVDRAEAIIRAFGYTRQAGDTVYGFDQNRDYTRWLLARRETPDRYEPIRAGRPPAIVFWYRTSPSPLAAQANPFVSPLDPPPLAPAMRTVILDGQGRLQEFRSVPPQRENDVQSAGVAAWDHAFAAAGLEMAAFTSVSPLWVPRDYADARLAWEGLLPGADVTVRVEASSYQGRPTYFQVTGPWTTATAQQPRGRSRGDRILIAAVGTFLLLLFGAAVILARRNLRSGRADRRGAARLAIFMGIAGVSTWLLQAHHTTSALDEFSGLARTGGDFALSALVLWINYIAIEPYVRRLWPDALLGWSRLLSGHFRDPRVGRDLLVGIGFGIAVAFLQVARRVVLPALGYAMPSAPFGNELDMLSGLGRIIGSWLLHAINALGPATILMLIAVLLRLLLHRWLTVPATVFVFSIILASETGTANTPLIFLFPIVGGLALTWLLTRHGLLALVVAMFTLRLLAAVPFVADPSHWAAAAGNWTLAALALLTLFAFYAARGGQPLFGRVLPE